MGDDQERPAPAPQMPGQPVDALDVEMVRRLVEHEQVGALDGVGDKQRAEGSASPLATGHGGEAGV